MNRKDRPPKAPKYAKGKGRPARHGLGQFTAQQLGPRIAQARRLAGLRGLKSRHA